MFPIIRIALFALTFVSLPLSAQNPLLAQLAHTLKIDTHAISVSGLSSGAYMAVQLQVAHAEKIMGAGIIAGGPYRCAAGKYADAWFDFSGMYAALSVCMHMNPLTWWREPKPDVAFSIAETARLAQEGVLDAPEHLAKQRVWLFSGANDRIVPQVVMDSLQDYYQHYLPAAQIAYLKTSQASHGMVTENQGSRCEITKPPFINDCDFDAAGALLQHIYGKLQAKGTASIEHLTSFDQQAFFDKADASVSLSAQGHLYIPAACQAGARCKLHIALHGCGQGEDFIGDRFYTQTGYNEWAETNQIVVLYPQVQAWSGGFSFSTKRHNPQGCWDWWGYSGDDYADKRGKQIQALMQMVGVLTHAVQ